MKIKTSFRCPSIVAVIMILLFAGAVGLKPGYAQDKAAPKPTNIVKGSSVDMTGDGPGDLNGGNGGYKSDECN
ncbi:MAG: hypothetical protein HQL18_05575, partial [Candidatus Omnitrophica bacterium]|nr:hypothetical protein [Candidatus Omnitrophota bacterium]